MQIVRKMNTENAKLLLVDISWEELNVSDTYDQFGQQMGSSDAGDCISIDSMQAVKYWNEDEDEDYDYKENTSALGEIISAYDYPVSYAKITSKLIEGVDFSSKKVKVTGYTYWDGQNWKTIVINTEYGEPTHEVLTGAEYDKMIAEYENAEQIKEGFGVITKLGKNFVFSESSFAGDFEIATVENIQEFEFRIDEEIAKHIEMQEHEMREHEMREAENDIYNKNRMREADEEQEKRMREAQ